MHFLLALVLAHTEKASPPFWSGFQQTVRRHGGLPVVSRRCAPSWRRLEDWIAHNRTPQKAASIQAEIRKKTRKPLIGQLSFTSDSALPSCTAMTFSLSFALSSSCSARSHFACNYVTKKRGFKNSIHRILLRTNFPLEESCFSLANSSFNFTTFSCSALRHSNL